MCPCGALCPRGPGPRRGGDGGGVRRGGAGAELGARRRCRRGGAGRPRTSPMGVWVSCSKGSGGSWASSAPPGCRCGCSPRTTRWAPRSGWRPICGSRPWPTRSTALRLPLGLPVRHPRPLRADAAPGQPGPPPAARTRGPRDPQRRLPRAQHLPRPVRAAAATTGCGAARPAGDRSGAACGGSGGCCAGGPTCMRWVITPTMS